MGHDMDQGSWSVEYDTEMSEHAHTHTHTHTYVHTTSKQAHAHPTGSTHWCACVCMSYTLTFCTVVLLGMLAKDQASMPVRPRTVQVPPW